MPLKISDKLKEKLAAIAKAVLAFFGKDKNDDLKGGNPY